MAGWLSSQVRPCGMSHLNLVVSSLCQVLLARFSTACFGMVQMVFWTGLATFCLCCAATLNPQLVAISGNMSKSSLIVRDCSCFTMLHPWLSSPNLQATYHTNLYQPGHLCGYLGITGRNPWDPGCEPCARVLLAFRKRSRNRWPSRRRCVAPGRFVNNVEINKDKCIQVHN